MGGRLYGGEGDYMDMEEVYGEGWLGYYETWDSMGGPKGDNKTTGT